MPGPNPAIIANERAVLGAILVDNAPLADVMAVLRPSDFSSESHRVIYRSMVELGGQGDPVDWVTLCPALKRMGHLEAVGGPVALAELSDAVPSAANIMHYVGVIQRQSLLRRVNRAAREIIAKTESDMADADDVLKTLQRFAFELSLGDRKHSKPEHIGSFLVDVVTEIEEKSAGKRQVVEITTGFGALDEQTLGFHRGELVVIAGRPSMGKTACLRRMALVGSKWWRWLIFSLEMTKNDLGILFLSGLSQVSHQKLRAGQLWEQDWSAVIKAQGDLSERKIVVDDTPDANLAYVESRIRQESLVEPVDIVGVDHLGLMAVMKAHDSRAREVGELTRGLKIIAKKFNIIVVALSQLNRKVEERSDKRPTLADLRDSGSVEQDADVVIFPYRDSRYNKASDEHKAELILSKQRNGPIGTIDVGWQPWCGGFCDLI